MTAGEIAQALEIVTSEGPVPDLHTTAGEGAGDQDPHTTDGENPDPVPVLHVVLHVGIGTTGVVHVPDRALRTRGGGRGEGRERRRERVGGTEIDVDRQSEDLHPAVPIERHLRNQGRDNS